MFKNIYLKYKIDCWVGTDNKMLDLLSHIIEKNCDLIMINKIIVSRLPFKYLLFLINNVSKFRDYFLLNYRKICLRYIKKKERFEFIIYHLNKLTNPKNRIFSQRYDTFKEEFYKCAINNEYHSYIKKYEKLSEC